MDNVRHGYGAGQVPRSLQSIALGWGSLYCGEWLAASDPPAGAAGLRDRLACSCQLGDARAMSTGESIGSGRGSCTLPDRCGVTGRRGSRWPDADAGGGSVQSIVAAVAEDVVASIQTAGAVPQ